MIPLRHPRAGIILQARLASRRLPGKALEPIDGRPLLAHCLRRLVASGVGPVVLATTDRPEDEALAAIALHAGVPVFRGHPDDVLDRMLRCARQFDFEHVVRATADNPAVDVQAPGRVLMAMRRMGADYVREEGLPYGAAVEAVRTDALMQAAILARDPFDREHVTPFIRRRTELFSVVALRAPAGLARPDVRLTVDTSDDLLHVRELYRRVPSEMPSLADLIAAADHSPHRLVA